MCRHEEPNQLCLRPRSRIRLTNCGGNIYIPLSTTPEMAQFEKGKSREEEAWQPGWWQFSSLSEPQTCVAAVRLRRVVYSILCLSQAYRLDMAFNYPYGTSHTTRSVWSRLSLVTTIHCAVSGTCASRNAWAAYQSVHMPRR